MVMLAIPMWLLFEISLEEFLKREKARLLNDLHLKAQILKFGLFIFEHLFKAVNCLQSDLKM